MKVSPLILSSRKGGDLSRSRLFTKYDPIDGNFDSFFDLDFNALFDDPLHRHLYPFFYDSVDIPDDLHGHLTIDNPLNGDFYTTFDDLNHDCWKKYRADQDTQAKQ